MPELPHDHRLESLQALHRPYLIIESLDKNWRFEQGDTPQCYPASMIKLPIAYTIGLALEQGLIDEAHVPISERLMTSNDAPSAFVPGYQARVWELVHAMLAFSDNVATNALIDLLGHQRATQLCQDAGLRETAIRRFLSGSLPRIADPASTGENAHSAHDAALLLRRIALREVPFAERLLGALDAQYWNSKLSTGLLPGDHFAHKTGETSDTSHDGGILTLATGRRYIIVLYSQSPSDSKTDAAFATVMREIRTVFFTNASHYRA